VAEAVLWCAAGVVFYVYLGYPVLLLVLGGLFARPIEKKPITPSVSLLVAAFNEGDVIEAKIRNALALDYPADRLEIVVASDGSTDGTLELAGKLADGDRVRVVAYPSNRGKLIVLNDTVPTLKGDVVALSDASSMLEASSLRHLMSNFADPTVGAVSGVYRVQARDEAELGRQEDFYWKYETFVKLQEARLGSILGAHGSLYAFRRSLYPFPEPGTINDDYVIPVRILQKGYRIAYEPRAVAYEPAHEMGGFSRRVRIMAGNLAQLREIKGLLWPPQWLALWFFLSHKAGRLVVPVAMVALLASNALLLDSGLYRALGLLQLAFYALALLGTIHRLRPKVLRLPHYFCMINAAAFVAAYRAVSGRGRVAWKR